MISNLTFKQENTIVNEPVVDLLKFLTDKLDSAAAKARLPSGHNPLQQLVLIISDGQFHEKVPEKKNRMPPFTYFHSYLPPWVLILNFDSFNFRKT